MMKYVSFLIRSSFEDLRRNKIRTFLTALGILIGVFSVVLLIAFGLGLKNYIQEQFNSLGTNLIIILPGQILEGGNFNSGAGLGGVTFDEKDVARLKRIESVQSIAPAYTKSIAVEANGLSESSDLAASTPEFFPVRNFEIDTGMFFTQTDYDKRAKKVVLGNKIAEKLFGTAGAAVGKSIRLENLGFTVIGVIKKKGGGGFGGPDLDSFSFVPFTSVLSLNPEKKFLSVFLKARTKEDIPLIKFYAKRELLRRYEEDDFSVVEQTEILNAVTSIFSVLNSILVAIGSISLLVGGVGIMNIMYASVMERTKEIGIKRSVGARRSDVLYQFLSEAVLLSVFGGSLGLFIAVAVVLLIQPVFPASINFYSVLVALGVSSVIGIFFGVFPAVKAANLSPIDAIRYE